MLLTGKGRCGMFGYVRSVSYDITCPVTRRSGRWPMTDNQMIIEDPTEPLPQPFGPFSPGMGTYVLLFFLVVIWSGLGLAFMVMDTASLDLTAIDPVLFIYLPTMVMQWLIFLAVLLAIRHESGRLTSIGFTRPRLVHLATALAFMVMSNLILMALQAALEMFGLPISPDVTELVKQAGKTTWWWLALSITAGICEEACFRGYLLTRLRAVIGRGWAWPVVIATLSFAAGHTYQGWGGLIVIFVYGLMFCALFLMTKSLWPGIFAHIIQDFAAIFLVHLNGS